MDETIRSTLSTTDEFPEDLSLQKAKPLPSNNTIDLKQLVNLISNKALSGLSSAILEQRPNIDPPHLLRPIIPKQENEEKINKEPSYIESKELLSLSKKGKPKLLKAARRPFIRSEITFDKKISTPEALPCKKEIPALVPLHSEEQLSDLLAILEEKKSSLPAGLTEQIYQIAKLIATSSANDKVHTLGELIYLASYLPDEELKCAKTKSCEHLTNWIRLKFQEKIQIQWDPLQKLKKSLSFSPIKQASTVLRNQYASLLARILVSKNGTINFGVIEPLIQRCPPENLVRLSSGDPLLSTLKTVQEDGAFRKQFASLELPDEINMASSAIIRASLSIGTAEKTGSLDAKKAIFSALFSHLRQGSDGSCFAMPLAIFLLSKYPSLCLEDFASLLGKNKLRREFNHTARDFPFILNGNAANFEKLPLIDAEGCFSDSKNGKLKVHQDPLILSLCQFLGITATKETISKIFSEYRLEFEKGVPLTIFIQKLVLEAKKLPIHAQHGIGELYQQALLMLQAQTTHPLLTAWINTIANMAEPDETGMVQSTVIRSILKTLEGEIQQILPSSGKLESALKTLKKKLTQHIQLQYDPSVQMQEKSSDQRSGSGAFVMYDTHNTEETDKWTRIDNPKAFTLFISNLFEVEEKQDHELKKLWKYLQKYTCTEKFLKKCLCEYYNKNEEFAHPLKQYQQISYSPWITKSGNSFSKVVQVYFENFVSSNSEIYSIENPKELFLKLASIETVVKASAEEKNALIPVRIPKVHAFNLLASHPSMIPFLKAKKRDEWIDKQLLLPCKLLSEQMVDAECYHAFISQIKKEIVPQEMLSQFRENPLNAPYKPMKMRELRERTLLSLNQLFKKKKVIQGELSSQLDILLIESLPKQSQTQIHEKAIHFADTNWSDGIHDVHLCLIMNPGKGELDIVACYDNGEKFFPLNGDHWIHGKKWEFFTEIELSAKKALARKK